jgi:hypothetical protein
MITSKPLRKDPFTVERLTQSTLPKDPGVVVLFINATVCPRAANEVAR